MYISNYSDDKLLTLARDGSVLATFTDTALQCPRGIHVTPAGQVLVSGWGSNTIIQVDSEGKRKLATLATHEDGIKSVTVFVWTRVNEAVKECVPKIMNKREREREK